MKEKKVIKAIAAIQLLLAAGNSFANVKNIPETECRIASIESSDSSVHSNGCCGSGTTCNGTC
ncbi:MAG: hypothetical protein AB8G05_13370 [Oligoflexales bacterium]